ncbi:hypothetical protein NPA31_012715 [Aurantimonas sp. MSK8Z-1]|nr:hypothetical protein [Aurantimonas sp. MSK8Z-1]
MMLLLRGLLAASLVALSAQATAAEGRDISGPLGALKSSVDAMLVTPLNHDGVDRRLSLEIVLLTVLPVPPSVEKIKSMPAHEQQAILAICSQMMMPMVESLNSVGGFPHISGVRITLRSKPTKIGPAGVGTYQTLVFPQDRGCKFGW